MKRILLSVLALFLSAGLFAQTGNVTFSVNMKADSAFNPMVDSVFVTGDFAGWTQPGSDVAFMMKPNSDSTIYSLTVDGVANGVIQYKYFIINNGPDWNQGEWGGDPNRRAFVNGDVTLNNTWANKPFQVTFNVDVTAIKDSIVSSKAAVFLAGDFKNGAAWAMPGSFAPLQLTPNADTTQFSLTLWLYKGTQVLYKNFLVFDSTASWDNGEWGGDPNRVDSIMMADTLNTVWGELGFTGIPANNAVQPNFSFYPNPVHEVLYINNLENANRIEIFNMVGQKVRVISNIDRKKLTIQTGDLNKGVYVIAAYGKNSVLKSMKFIKQ